MCGWIRPGQRGWPAPARSKSCDNSVCWPAAATAVDVEFVKSFTPVRFPKSSIFQIATFWAKKLCGPVATAVDVLNQRWYAMISSRTKFCPEVFNKLRLIRSWLQDLFSRRCASRKRWQSQSIKPESCHHCLVYILNIYSVCKQMLPRTRSPFARYNIASPRFCPRLDTCQSQTANPPPLHTLNSAQQ